MWTFGQDNFLRILAATLSGTSLTLYLFYSFFLVSEKLWWWESMVDSVVLPGRLPNTFPQVISKNNLETVCHESKQLLLVTTRKMRVGPSESACRSRHQTTLSCCGKEPWWWALRKRPGIRLGQVWNMETSASEPLMRCRKIKDVVKTGTCFYSRISSGDACLLPERRPA